MLTPGNAQAERIFLRITAINPRPWIEVQLAKAQKFKNNQTFLTLQIPF